MLYNYVREVIYIKIIITAGGTMGHINPALAIINIFMKDKNTEVLYIGTHNRMESKIIPEKDIKYVPIEVYGFSKTNLIRDIKNIYLIKKSINKCSNIMKEFKPDVVIGCGGYVTYPVIRSAYKLGIKTFIHEQNSIPGKSNIMLAKYADLVGVSFESSKSYFETAKRIVYTGNPCGEEALNVKKISKESIGFKADSKLITIVAGSLGSTTFNDKFKVFLNTVDKEKYNVLYITGRDYYDDFVKDSKFPSNVKVVPYFDNLAGILKDTDLVISRAGASTISEILALGVPSILVPSPYVANNHQYYNALDIERLGMCEIIEEKNLDVSMIDVAINELMYNDTKYKKMKNALNNYKGCSSSSLIYKEIKGLVEDEK